MMPFHTSTTYYGDPDLDNAYHMACLYEAQQDAYWEAKIKRAAQNEKIIRSLMDLQRRVKLAYTVKKRYTGGRKTS